jgi:hypothetical protein
MLEMRSPDAASSRLAGKSEDGAFYLTAGDGRAVRSTASSRLLASDPALRSDSRVSYALRGGGRDLKMRAFALIQKEAA